MPRALLNRHALALLLAPSLFGCWVSSAVAIEAAAGCVAHPPSPLTVDVKSKGAVGDGATDDTAAIQSAIDAVTGSGGTVLLPRGIYLINALKHLQLGSNMTLRLEDGAIIKAKPNKAPAYALLQLSGVSNVTVTGGTLQGERQEHQGKAGEWGMGLSIDGGAHDVTIIGITSKDMWGDGFYVAGGSGIAFCSVTADGNRRQGLSITAADDVLITHSTFENTQGTRPAAGIDLEPDNADQTIGDIRIERSKFFGNAGPGIQFAGKRGHIEGVQITRNVFKDNRPLLIEDAPAVGRLSICDNRLLTPQTPSAGGLNSYAQPVDATALQGNCEDIGLEKRRNKKRAK